MSIIEREKMYIKFIVDAEAEETDAEKWCEEKALYNLGKEYAKKYASRPSVVYKYFDRIDNEYYSFDQKLKNPRHLHYVGKEYTISL